MISRSQNPFLSRANSNRLKHEEVQSLWVELDADTQHPAFDPVNPLPTIVLGGKGSGKTHLFRYHSFPVQGLRYDSANGDGWGSGLERDGYMGIYTRADGLSSSRFVGKGVKDEQWHVVFKHYVELWLGQGLLDILVSLSERGEISANVEEEIALQAKAILDPACQHQDVVTFKQLARLLRRSQQEIDGEVNAAAFTRKIEPRIDFSPGDLIFGLPTFISSRVGQLKDVVYCYYIDECENLTESQQQYINTLVREARPLVTFRIGVRSYGMRTYKTDSGHGEEITEGSEYQKIALDAKFRAATGPYRKFAKVLLDRRLKSFESTLLGQGMDMQACFGAVQQVTPLSRQETGSRRLENLRKNLGDIDARLAADVVDRLAWPEHSLEESAAIFQFYKHFAEGQKDLLRLASSIRLGLEGKDAEMRRVLSSNMKHYKGDFLAQIRRDRRGGGDRTGGEYSGLDAFIVMSEGLPRSLLTVVGNVLHCAAYRGELPLGEGRISILSQLEGARDSAERFFRDLPKAGTHSHRIWSSVNRLGELFRMNRFSDKPIECSLIAFSLCLDDSSQDVRDVVDEAEKRSFLIRSQSPQKDRWSHQVWDKFHINRALCPKYDLPTAVRGTARLTSNEAEAVFGSADDAAFKVVRDSWNERLNWPFGRDMPRKGDGLFEL